MPGFRLRRENQTVAIDTDYFNLALRQSGTVRTSPTGSTNPYVRQVTFTAGGDQPIVAIRSAYPVCITFSKVNGDGTVTYTLWGFATGDFDFDVQFWIFDLPKYGQMFTSGAKMIARNPGNGEVVFDSRMKYLKVQDFFVGSSSTSTQDETRNYGKYPAVVLVNRAWASIKQQMTQGTTRVEELTSAVWTDGNSVKLGSRNIYYMIGPSSPGERYYAYSGGNRQVMVVDIENY